MAKNTGNGNTGDWNTGYCNTGNGNTADWNTGHCNTGNWNTGNRNSGYCNTGNGNTGDCNTGNWNTGDWNTGDCNTVTPTDILVFNKPCARQVWHKAAKPDWMYAELTKWVPEDKMTDEEKSAYPSYVTTRGYLKAYASLQHAWRDAWDNADAEQKALTLKLPNFDREVFIEIFGFDPVEKEKRQITLELTDEQIAAVQKMIEEEEAE